MRVIITGGAGFIGSHLVDHYLQKGNEVIVIDNLITGSEENIARHRASSQFTFMQKDVCSVTGVEGEVDLILHFASPASPFDYLEYPIETMRTASLGTFNMLEIAMGKRAKFLLASTSEVYGDPEEHPQKEDYWGNVNPIGPRSVYDEGKRFAEALTTAYNRKQHLDVGIVRIFNTYGERMHIDDGRLIPTFVNQALRDEAITIFGDGTQTRSFCYISDMVEAISRASGISYARPVNIGNPMEFTVLEIAELIKDLCGSKSSYEFRPLPENDPLRRRPDISKAKELYRWQPKVDLQQGLLKVIEWFRRNHD